MGALALALLAVLSLVRYAAWPVDFDNPQGALPSPLYWPALWVFGLLAVPLGWSYWLTPAPVDALRWPFRWSSPILLAGALMWWSFLESESVPDGWLTQVRIVAFLPVLAMLYYVGVALFVRIRLRLAARRKAGEHLLEEADAISEIRYSLSILLKFGLVFTAALLFVWLIDTLGVLVYLLAVGYLEIAAASYVAITLLSLLARKGAMALTLRGPKEGRPPISVNVLAHLAAVLLVVAILSLIHAITHAIAWESAGASNGRGSFVSPLAVVAVIALVLSLLMGRVWAFVNRSTLHPLYESRLRRAYLGASNPARIMRDASKPPVTRVHEDDGIDLEDYHPEAWGAPIHILNVTVNQTVGSRSALQHKDRKGMGLAVGPAGVSLGRAHHALWDSDEPTRGLTGWVKDFLVTRKDKEKQFRVFSVPCSPEELDLGHWMSISGAAVSTGLGYRTSLGLSLLAGLFNIRLGYWWNSDIKPESRFGTVKRSLAQHVLSTIRNFFPVQAAFLSEWLARFRGVGREHWYLSDGGHFENMGAYELVRRRLPFIIVCDGEQDENYQFSGLANLVRKARTDFGAEIEFLSTKDLEQTIDDQNLLKWLGPLDSLCRGQWAQEPVIDPKTGQQRVAMGEPHLRHFSLSHAALAKIVYSDEADQKKVPDRWLLYIKPTLVGDEPVDVLNYHNDHPKFPHEPTSDQFFGEAQWESYRRLGEHIAGKLFRQYGGKWTPGRAIMGN
jgi:hypothetical protein